MRKIVKLQQFSVIKLHSDLLRFKNYNLTYNNLNELRKKKWLVSLADSQALRTIRRIRYNRTTGSQSYVYDENISFKDNYLRYQNFKDYLKNEQLEIQSLKKEKKKISKKEYTEENIKRLHWINKRLDEMLFIPEYLLVVIDQSSQYIKALKGENKITINGYKYKRLLCGAGMARNNTVAFVREDIEEELKKCLQNDWNSNVLITENKYNAYFALSSTATYMVSEPNFAVIKDCEIKQFAKVDWVEKTGTIDSLENKDKIVPQNKELDFNLFDGGGLIDIRRAKKWAEELELDYIPSVFIVRNIFVKGCLFTVDFRKFAKEIAHTDKVHNCLYDNNLNIENNDIDVILTKSMFKLWNAYAEEDDYQIKCYKNFNYWGVSRVSPKKDDDYVTTNYQFCQVLDLKEKDIEELCSETVNWLRGVSGYNREQAMLFLMGNLVNKYDNPNELFSNISDNIVKALAVNPIMIEDGYIRQKLTSAINKKINESYLGKLVVRGCFSTMIPDPYALMEWAFGLEVKGLLKNKEHYSRYWNNRGVTKAVGMRSPLTWRSEVNPLVFIKNDKTEEWYQYLDSGIIYNVWGVDCMLHADSDFDGDIVCSTDNQSFVNCRFTDEDYSLPITYEKKTVEKRKVRESHLHKADIASFNTTIGQVTNYSTSFYDLLFKYKNDYSEYGRKCYNEIIERLKLTRKAQGDSIDAAKGIKSDPYPSHWIKRQIILETDSEEVIERKKFLNDVCADKKPYFFKYRYYQSKSDDQNFNEGISLLSDSTLVDKEKYNPLTVLIDYGSPMNNICHYMENNLKDIKKYVANISDEEIVKLLKTNDNLQDNNKKEFIRELCEEYCSEKAIFRKGLNKKYSDIEQCAKFLKEKAMTHFNNSEEVANYVVEVCYLENNGKYKSFAWNVFGSYLVDNLLKNSKDKCRITIPMRDDNGDIKYLFNNYSLREVNLDATDI